MGSYGAMAECALQAVEMMEKLHEGNVTPRRPHPPENLIGSLCVILRPAPDLSAWTQETILSEDGSLHNPDHAHLIDADIGFLWASSAFARRGRTQAHSGRLNRLLVVELSASVLKYLFPARLVATTTHTLLPLTAT